MFEPEGFGQTYAEMDKAVKARWLEPRPGIFCAWFRRCQGSLSSGGRAQLNLDQPQIAKKNLAKKSRLLTRQNGISHRYRSLDLLRSHLLQQQPPAA